MQNKVRLVFSLVIDFIIYYSVKHMVNMCLDNQKNYFIWKY